ncbi:hypothetical protein FAGAP_2101 [Fusarium agapanthi]|uniref:C2H2-type domain-containing protein n=1 Tax=Fusarium agapanthi TaxID=1803897 RepID=A0A9P5E9R0_9HYPO|nr:hypothetical protein FAGAP_2101 [Fusarium agapanthi]
MYSYPTPLPEFTAQSQSQDGLHNRPVANYPWAVQGGLSAINTNVRPQYGFSESPLPMSSSTNGYPSYDMALLSQPTFRPYPSFSSASEWPHPRPQHGSSSQSLVPATKTEAIKVLIKRFGWLWLLLKVRSKLRGSGRRHQRRHSASDYTSRTAGHNNGHYLASSLSVSLADDARLGNLVTGDEADLFSPIDPTNHVWFDALGILNGNSLLPVPAGVPRPATVLFEEDVPAPIPGQRPIECLEETVPPINLMNQPQQEIIVPGQSKKRAFDCVELDDSSTDEADGMSVDKKRPKTASAAPRFACPFYKHDPERYANSRSCCGPGWETVHRVKEHIFRSHTFPEHECQRCFQSFKTELKLSRHLRASAPCEVQSRITQEHEGINASQSKALHARARKCDSGADLKEVEEQRWNDVYKIIFPGGGLVPTPYYDRLQKSNNDDFGMNLMSDFEQRMRGNVSEMKNLQPTLAPLVVQLACNTLRERRVRSHNKPWAYFNPSDWLIKTLARLLPSLMHAHYPQVLEQFIISVLLNTSIAGSYLFLRFRLPSTLLIGFSFICSMSDPSHNDQWEQERSFIAKFWENPPSEGSTGQVPKLKSISNHGEGVSHLVPPSYMGYWGKKPMPSININIASIGSDVVTPLTESSETSWSTGGISMDSGCFCSAGNMGESCTHAPLTDSYVSWFDHFEPENVLLPGTPQGIAGLSGSQRNIQAVYSSQVGGSPTLQSILETRASLPASSGPSDCGYSRETSADSVETCWSSDQASSSSAVTERRKYQLVVQIIGRLQEWLEVMLRRHGAYNGQTASSSGSTPVVGAASHAGEASSSQPRRKRQRSGSDDGFGEDDKTPDRTQKKRGKTSDSTETRYVCPFFKHNREKYKTSQWKSCCWPGWTSVHRVKEHLYRRHMLPKFRCNRCRQDLKSAFNLNEHQRADTICQRQSEEPEEEGIDEEQERLLRVRKRKNGKAPQVAEEEKWVEMYKILFPHDDPIPSPYPELCPLQPEQDIEHPGANVLDSFEDYARREFSRRMRPRIESLVDGIFEQTLTSQTITDVANNVLSGIMESFRESQSQETCQPESQDLPSRIPSPHGLPVESSNRVPQEIHTYEAGSYSNLETDLDEILSSLDANQSLEFERWGIEDEGINTFHPFGLQVEQYNKANA